MAGQQVFQGKKKKKKLPVSSSKQSNVILNARIAADFHSLLCEVSSPLKNKSCKFQVSGSISTSFKIDLNRYYPTCPYRFF